MKLVMTLLARDEADIISSNIEFHLAQGVDFFIAMDNLSVDETTGILRDYERRGILHYIHQAQDDYAQQDWVTHMARLARTKFAADWVINNDADEFWQPAQGDLKHAIGSQTRHCHALAVNRVNFLPRPCVGAEAFQDRMVVREVQSFNGLGHPLPGKICHRAFADVQVSQGNHKVYRNGTPLAPEPAPIMSLHFPMRSFPQFENKIAKGGAAYSRNANLPVEIGSSWRQLYKMWQNGELKAYYRACVPDEESILRGLREGRFVTDERVKAVLANRTLRLPPPPPYSA